MNFKPIKYILAFFIALLSTVSYAQGIIDEDFLENVETNVKSMWDENIPAFNVSVTPDKYKNESAIIIGYSRSVTIDKKSRSGFFSSGEKSLMFYEHIRFKIKLNDKNSVGSFTEIYFRYSDKEDGFSARITKSNGIVKNVSLNGAIDIESTDNVPEFFKSFFDQESGRQSRYYKVAIPDLEVGDILEYVSDTKSKLNVANSGYIEFSPQYEICNKIYPILFNQIAIETDDKSFFKSMSVNDAPDFKKEPSGDQFYRYVFTDRDRGVEKDVNFIKAYQVYPLVKFQVIYANNEKTKGALIGEKGEIKTGFTKEELAKKAWEDYVQVGNYGYGRQNNGMPMTIQQFIDGKWTLLRKLGAKDWSDKEYITNAYYLIRNEVVNSDGYLSDKVFAYMFGSLLYQRNIQSDLIITISNAIGKLKDVLFDNEIRYVIRVDGKSYFNCTDHTNPNELVESLLGNDAYLIKEPQKKTGEQEILPVVLPDATEKDNNATFIINTSLNQDMSTLAVSRKSIYTGLSKARNISNYLRYTPYMLEDWKNYEDNSPTEKMNDRQEEEYSNSVKALKDRFAENKPIYEKKLLEGEFYQKVKFNKFSIESDGRTQKTKDHLSFTEDFELSGMIRKAGKKYLVNLSGLVGSQLQIKKKERIRTNDISIGYACSYNWTINFKVPDGYTVSGLKELNSNIDNEAGTYTCSAAEQNGTVTINVTKVYKKANLPKEKWNDMLAFIDAAYNNYYKYILLTPKH